ncbi:hypothetical protein ACFLZY_03440 [Patescibacteria group bacterium]
MKKFGFLAILFLGGVCLSSAQAASLSDQVQGKILLQVESVGEAWYVNPVNTERYYLGHPEDAFGVMRSLGLGTSNANLALIPIGYDQTSGDFIGLTQAEAIDQDQDSLPDIYEEMIGTNPSNPDTDGDGYLDGVELRNDYNPQGSGQLIYNQTLINRLSGRILLQVEGAGQAWYLNPDDQHRYYLGRPHQAFSLMRMMGLGISNSNLSQVTINEASLQPPTPLFVGKPEPISPLEPYECPTNDQDCFNQKFAVCEPARFIAIFDLKPLFPEEIVYYSEIIGPETDDCVVNHKFLQNPNSDWVEKEMVCQYDGSIKGSIFSGEVALLTTCTTDNPQDCTSTYYNTKTEEQIAVVGEGDSPVECNGELFNLMTGGL